MGLTDPPSKPHAIPAGAATTSRHLLVRACRGDRSALDAVVARHVGPLRRWASGRLPRWARTIVDTADLVQDAMLQTLRRLDRFEPLGHHALQGYLRRIVDNRIRDEFRRIGRRGLSEMVDDTYVDPGPSQHEQAIAEDLEHRYRTALSRLRPSDQRLIVGRVELGYSFQQLALITGRQRAGAARVALSRALARLADEMDRV